MNNKISYSYEGSNSYLKLGMKDVRRLSVELKGKLVEYVKKHKGFVQYNSLGIGIGVGSSQPVIFQTDSWGDNQPAEYDKIKRGDERYRWHSTYGDSSERARYSSEDAGTDEREIKRLKDELAGLLSGLAQEYLQKKEQYTETGASRYVSEYLAKHGDFVTFIAESEGVGICFNSPWEDLETVDKLPLDGKFSKL